jgi:hypothetical protein
MTVSGRNDVRSGRSRRSARRPIHLPVDPEQRGGIYCYHLERLYRGHAVLDGDAEHPIHEPVLGSELRGGAVGGHDEAMRAHPILRDRAQEFRQVRA